VVAFGGLGALLLCNREPEHELLYINLYFFLSNGTIESTALNFKKKKSLAAGYNNVYLEEGNTFVFVNYFFVKIENTCMPPSAVA
jgi:hypothetical protein